MAASAQVFPEHARPPANERSDGGSSGGGYSGGSGGGYGGGGGGYGGGAGGYGGAPAATQQVAKLYVGNLATDVDDERLTNFFSKYGKVIDSLIVKEREDNTKSRGFGFITFEDEVCESRDGARGRVGGGEGMAGR